MPVGASSASISLASFGAACCKGRNTDVSDGIFPWNVLHLDILALEF